VNVPKTNADADKHTPHKGTIAQLPTKTEKAGMGLMLDAQLYCKPCNAAGVHSGQVDFIYNSGPVSGVMGAREMDILQNVAKEDVLIETVTGERSISKLYGNTIFGKTRILNGHKGSVLVSQFATKQMYQVINPDKDTFILCGWEHNPNTRGKVWYFARDEERYKDKLLHSTVDLAVAKSFGINKESKFYDPVGIKSEEVCGNEQQKYCIIDTMHSRYQHASANEMKNMLDQNEWQGVTERDISSWYNNKGRFCSGFVEGKMKEHAHKALTKPLASNVPGELTVGNIMFVETKNNVKKPLLVHVDVCTKLITGVPLQNRTEEECTKAVLQIKSEYEIEGQTMKQLVFDREPGIVLAENELKSKGIDLILKAAGQKVGLAEVTIHLIRVKARATKAGVRAKYGYLPSNQFNMDLCLDSIAVLNRIPKAHATKNPYELFSEKSVDVMRDFRADWGELIVVKKPKGISSDLGVTGQWAVVIRHIMNHTGVLKVYLIQSKKYAYHLHFARALAPEWVLEALNLITVDMSIGFGDGAKEDLQGMIKDHHKMDVNDYDLKYDAIDIDDDDVTIMGTDRVDVIMKSIESIGSCGVGTSLRRK
jgi:hypothetical protein